MANNFILNLRQIEDKLLGFQSSFSAPINSADLEHILTKYWSDDFKLVTISANSFLLIANESLTPISEGSGKQDIIKLQCTFKKNENEVLFQFSTPAPTNLRWLLIFMLIISILFLFGDTFTGLLSLLFTIIAYYWFRGVYHHQYKTMVKYFKQDIYKYLLFKQKGFDYFTRKSH